MTGFLKVSPAQIEVSCKTNAIYHLTFSVEIDHNSDWLGWKVKLGWLGFDELVSFKKVWLGWARQGLAKQD